MRAAGETKNDFVRSKNRNQKESKMEEPLSERIETGENEQTMGFWGKLGNIFGQRHLRYLKKNRPGYCPSAY
jgi:hypothetical protein